MFFLSNFRDKLNFYEEKLSYYRELNDKDKSTNREEEEQDERNENSNSNENDLEDRGSTYRMLKVEIEMVNHNFICDYNLTNDKF